MKTRTRLIATIVLGSAFVAAVAQAQNPDDGAGIREQGGVAALQSGAANHPDNRAEPRGPGAISAQQRTTGVTASSHPDNRAEPRGPGAIAAQQQTTDVGASSHPDNRAEPRGPGAFTPTTVVVASTSNGFDWGDALIGGLGGVGTALLLTGALFLITSQRSKTRMA
jgi:hypothetical protein